jgi:hypothetical protein
VKLSGRVATAVGLLRYNARRCEQAKHKHCQCRCGGRFHGHAHPESWVYEMTREIAREEIEQQQRSDPNAQLFENGVRP